MARAASRMARSNATLGWTAEPVGRTSGAGADEAAPGLFALVAGLESALPAGLFRNGRLVPTKSRSFNMAASQAGRLARTGAGPSRRRRASGDARAAPYRSMRSDASTGAHAGPDSPTTV